MAASQWVYARLAEDGKDVVANPALQADRAEFADMWANNIAAQDWQEHGRRYQPRKLQAPDLETLLEWMMDDGGCEATDTCTCAALRGMCRCGCWVEPDGICPHGCQSWFLVLGLIQADAWEAPYEQWTSTSPARMGRTRTAG